MRGRRKVARAPASSAGQTHPAVGAMAHHGRAWESGRPADRDGLAVARDALAGERDGLVAGREHLAAARDGLAVEGDHPPRFHAELTALLARFGLAPSLVTRFARLLEALCSDPLAPTSVREPARALELHLADSLVALELEQLACARRVVDIGSGAGLPGLPLALALPEARFALLDSSSRKCAFVARVAAACGARNVSTVAVRAEEWHEGAGTADVATARALAPLSVTVEYAAPLLRVGGDLVVWRGRRERDQERAAADAAVALGLEPGEIHAVQPFPAAEHRHLHLYRKVRETPPGFPRRPGLARKRPLGRPRSGPGTFDPALGASGHGAGGSDRGPVASGRGWGAREHGLGGSDLARGASDIPADRPRRGDRASDRSRR